LRSLHKSLVKNGINVDFEDFKPVYFEVRERLYAETNRNLEEPHFNIRISQTLKRLGYNFDVSNTVVTEATQAFADEFMRYLRLDSEAIEVLHKLRETYRLGLISNFAIPECVWKLLERYDLKKFFGVVVISGAINKRKPSPEIFERALKALDVDSSEAVFVGDMPRLDVKGAKNAGIKAILIERRPIEEITDVKSDKTIKTLKELPAVLEDC